MILAPIFQWHKELVEYRKRQLKEIHEKLREVHNAEVKFVKEGVKKQEENPG